MNTISDYQNSYNNYNQVSGTQSRPHHRHQKSNPLDDLVKAGTITQDQENSIKSALKAGLQTQQAGAVGSTQTNPLGGLVTDGEITQDQENAIKTAFESAKQTRYNFQMQGDESNNENPLDDLVKAGTITQDQENSIKSAFENAFNSNQIQAAYGTSTNAVNPLDSLVKAGTITQEQENSINNTLQSARPHHHHHHHAQQAAQSGSDQASNQVNPLDELVKAGTITQDQENSIKSAFESAIEAYQTNAGYEDSSTNSLEGLGQV